MANYYSLETHRFGEHSVFYVAPRPPDLPADYPIPADVRKLIDASDAAWVDLELAHADWTDIHGALGMHPRSAELDAEVDAWDALTAQAATTNTAAEAAVKAVDEWRARSRAEAGAYEIARLEDWIKAGRALATAQATYSTATATVGRTYGVIASWLEGRYSHDDRPRAVIVGESLHNERVRAYWENLAAGLPEDTLLPGDFVTAGFEHRRR
jgi:hypothetical protein